MRASARWIRLLEVLVFCIPLLVAHAYFKYTYLQFGGLEIIERALSSQSVSVMQYVQLYAWDVLESLLVFPLLLLGISCLLTPRWRSYAYSSLLWLCLMMGVVAWATYHTIGAFPNWELARDFIRTYRSEPELVSPVAILETRQWLKIVILLSLPVMPLIVLRHNRLRILLISRGRYLMVSCFALLVAAAGLLVTTGSVSVYHAGNLRRIVREALRNDQLAIPAHSSLSRAELRAAYHRVVSPTGLDGGVDHGSPGVPPKRVPPNVIFLVLETAASRDYVLAGPASNMPFTSTLLQHSLEAEQHYSSYPYSIRANFTLFSSVYDLPSRKMMMDYLLDSPSSTTDALPRILREEGYDTRYYYPVPLSLGDRERDLLRLLGFEKIWEGQKHERKPGSLPAAVRAKAEREMFHRVGQDLALRKDTSAPFFLSIVSLIGHSPYVDLRSDAERASGAPTRTALVGGTATFLDAMIRELVTYLQELHLLDNTILVITGDHGVRSQADDPTLDLRFANEQSFRVPLLIHYPAAFPAARRIGCVTSHVDVVPTVLSLMGMRRDSYLHQGAPLWDVCRQDRVTFFLGGHYIGSNALHYRGKFFMVNEVTQTMFINGSFQFGPQHLVTTDDAEAAALSAKLREFVEVQRSWVAYLRRPVSGDAAAGQPTRSEGTGSN